MHSQNQHRATISDVARLAGVSISTVSRVMNDTAPVANETEDKVRSAVQQLDFTPHAAARTLAGRKTNTIGLLLPELGSSFFIPTLRGIEAAAREAGLDLLIFTFGAGPLARKQARQPLGEHNTDGLLIFSTQLDNAELVRMYQRGFPIVLLHRSAPKGLPIPSVRFENHLGVRQAIDHLIEVHGRRRIVFLRGDADNEDSFYREIAYREALDVHGLPFDPALVGVGGFNEMLGEAVISAMIADGLQFDAIFTGDDEAAAGVMMALRNGSLSIPEDVAVVGFDDLSSARHFNPSLTTVRAPIETASYLAAHHLACLIQGDPVELVNVLPVELVLRRSCGCS